MLRHVFDVDSTQAHSFQGLLPALAVEEPDLDHLTEAVGLVQEVAPEVVLLLKLMVESLARHWWADQQRLKQLQLQIILQAEAPAQPSRLIWRLVPGQNQASWKVRYLPPRVRQQLEQLWRDPLLWKLLVSYWQRCMAECSPVPPLLAIDYLPIGDQDEAVLVAVAAASVPPHLLAEALRVPESGQHTE